MVDGVLLGLTTGSVVPLCLYWFNPRPEDHVIARHQLCWIVLLLIAAMFAFAVALDPQQPLGAGAGRALGWPLGYATGYAILYGGRGQPASPDVVARNQRAFRWGVVLLVGITLVCGIVAWYRLT